MPNDEIQKLKGAVQNKVLSSVVTECEFKLRPVGPEILAGLMVIVFDQARQVLTKYRAFVESAPPELNVCGPGGALPFAGVDSVR